MRTNRAFRRLALQQAWPELAVDVADCRRRRLLPHAHNRGPSSLRWLAFGLARFSLIGSVGSPLIAEDRR
jgi:hypothetical protein